MAVLVVFTSSSCGWCKKLKDQWKSIEAAIRTRFPSVTVEVFTLTGGKWSKNTPEKLQGVVGAMPSFLLIPQNSWENIRRGNFSASEIIPMDRKWDGRIFGHHGINPKYNFMNSKGEYDAKTPVLQFLQDHAQGNFTTSMMRDHVQETERDRTTAICRTRRVLPQKN